MNIQEVLDGLKMPVYQNMSHNKGLIQSLSKEDGEQLKSIVQDLYTSVVSAKEPMIKLRDGGTLTKVENATLVNLYLKLRDVKLLELLHAYDEIWGDTTPTISPSARSLYYITQPIWKLQPHNIPKKYNNVNLFSQTYPQAVQETMPDKINTILDNLDKWFIFVGSAGTGKTHTACGIIHYLRAISTLPYMFNAPGTLNDTYGLTASFTTAFNMMARIRSTFTKESDETTDDVMYYYSNVDYLVIDEFGRTKDSDFARDAMFEILNNRYNDPLKKRTIIMTNMSMEQLKESTDASIVSRFYEVAVTVNFNWASLRQPVII